MNTGLSIAFQPGQDEPTARASTVATVLDSASHLTEQCKCERAFDRGSVWPSIGANIRRPLARIEESAILLREP